MNYKFYFFTFLFLFSFSKTYSQNQNVNFGNINFQMSTMYKLMDKDILKEVSKSVRKENTVMDNVYKQIELDYNERTTFSYINKTCNCLNNLVISQTKMGFSFHNDEYSSNSELQNGIKEMYDETIEANKGQINSSGIAKITKINPTAFKKTKYVNYFHISSEMLILDKNKTIVADVFTIPVENFFYQLEFSTDKKNYETVLPLLKEIINSLQINK